MDLILHHYSCRCEVCLFFLPYTMDMLACLFVSLSQYVLQVYTFNFKCLKGIPVLGNKFGWQQELAEVIQCTEISTRAFTSKLSIICPECTYHYTYHCCFFLKHWLPELCYIHLTMGVNSERNTHTHTHNVICHFLDSFSSHRTSTQTITCMYIIYLI